MKCSNCKRTLSCGCQKKVAKDGTKCCANCVTAYNKNINLTNTN